VKQSNSIKENVSRQKSVIFISVELTVELPRASRDIIMAQNADDSEIPHLMLYLYRHSGLAFRF